MITPKNHDEYQDVLLILRDLLNALDAQIVGMPAPPEPTGQYSDAEWSEHRMKMAAYYARKDGVQIAFHMVQAGMRNWARSWDDRSLSAPGKLTTRRGGRK